VSRSMLRYSLIVPISTPWAVRKAQSDRCRIGPCARHARRSGRRPVIRPAGSGDPRRTFVDRPRMTCQRTDKRIYPSTMLITDHSPLASDGFQQDSVHPCVSAITRGGLKRRVSGGHCSIILPGGKLQAAPGRSLHPPQGVLERLPTHPADWLAEPLADLWVAVHPTPDARSHRNGRAPRDHSRTPRVGGDRTHPRTMLDPEAREPVARMAPLFTLHGSAGGELSWCLQATGLEEDQHVRSSPARVS
jgi:hypothetical protein